MISTNGGSKLVSGSATYLASNVINAAIPFALLPVLTRVLGPIQYGQVAMFQMLVGALAAITGLCVHGAANRKYYDQPRDSPVLGEFIGACLQILAVSSIAVFALIWIFRDALAEWSGLDTSWVVAAAIASAAGVIINIRLGQWQVRGQARRYGIFQVSQGLLTMLLALLLVVALLLGSGGRILAQLLVVVGFALLATYWLRRDGLATFGWRPDLIREALAFGIPLVPHVAGMFLLVAADRAVINQTFGLREVGIYVVAVQVAMAMGIVFDAINKAYVPWLFERLQRNLPDEKLQIVRWTYLQFGGALIAAASLAVLGQFLVPVLAGPGYEGAAEVLGWLALGQAFNGMYLMVTNYIFYSKRTGLLSFATLSTGVFHVALLFALTSRFGLSGAGMAFALSMFVRFIATWAIAQDRHPMPWVGALLTRPTRTPG